MCTEKNSFSSSYSSLDNAATATTSTTTTTAATPTTTTTNNTPSCYIEETFHRSSHHLADAFKKMNELRQLHVLCDVTLNTGATQLAAHKVVLATTIPYFCSVFNTGYKSTTPTAAAATTTTAAAATDTEASVDVVSVAGVDSDVVICLVNFAYTGRLTINARTVRSVFAGACYFQLDELTSFCAEYILKSISAENAVELYVLGTLFSCERLTHRAGKFICKHFNAVAQTESFRRLDRQTLAAVLCKSELHVASEEDVFGALCAWVQHDAAARSGFMYELLQHVRLPLLPAEYLTEIVENHPACISSFECCYLIFQAKNYHRRPKARHLLPPTQLATPRCCSDVVGTVYAFGGSSVSNDALFERYAPNIDTWERLAVPPVAARKFAGVTALDGRLYVTGGYADACLDSVHVFTPTTGKWTDAAPMAVARAWHACCAHQGRVYVCGGDAQMHATPTCERYDPLADRWTTVAAMQVARWRVPAVSYRGRVCVLGGHSAADQPMSSVESYDAQEDAWAIGAPMLSRRSGHCAAVCGERLFVFGGVCRVSLHGGPDVLNSCEMFDPRSRQFVYIRPMLAVRCSFAVAVSNGRIYCFGGVGGRDRVGGGGRDALGCSTEVYNTATGGWGLAAGMTLEGSYGIGGVTLFEDW